ncbi:hypothetical protein PG985_001607 [Apiospora marii]|uniref:Uncharacterized protein n=1 Tax=Apiospora marii TaxID=335849 RepID=A0ABR1RIE0_9PEZI
MISFSLSMLLPQVQVPPWQGAWSLTWQPQQHGLAPPHSTTARQHNTPDNDINTTWHQDSANKAQSPSAWEVFFFSTLHEAEQPMKKMTTSGRSRPRNDTHPTPTHAKAEAASAIHNSVDWWELVPLASLADAQQTNGNDETRGRRKQHGTLASTSDSPQVPVPWMFGGRQTLQRRREAWLLNAPPAHYGACLGWSIGCSAMGWGVFLISDHLYLPTAQRAPAKLFEYRRKEWDWLPDQVWGMACFEVDWRQMLREGAKARDCRSRKMMTSQTIAGDMSVLCHEQELRLGQSDS